MSSVLFNMKRFNIAYLPSKSVTAPKQVLQAPCYSLISYAAATNNLFLSHSTDICVDSGSANPNNSIGKDITFFLTHPDQYVLKFQGHIPVTPSNMWTITTTITNNKKGFVTLITPLNKFCKQTASERAMCRWYKSANKGSNKSNGK